MPQPFARPVRLRREIGVVLVIKILFLLLIWKLFVHGHRVHPDDAHVASHLLSASGIPRLR